MYSISVLKILICYFYIIVNLMSKLINTDIYVNRSANNLVFRIPIDKLYFETHMKTCKFQ